MTILIQGGRVFLPQLGIDQVADLVVADGRLRPAPAEGGPQPEQSLEAHGLLVLPGLIDMHVHLREPGQTNKETIASGTRAAAAGGFALVCAESNTTPPIDSEARLAEARQAIQRSAVVEVVQKVALTKGQAGKELARVCHPLASDDGEPIADPALLRQALAWCAQTGALPCLHEEETQASREAIERAFGKGQPFAREPELIARDLGLIAEHGGRVHFCHVSTAESVRLLREAQRKGLAVTAEATPHHLCLSRDDIPGRDPNFKMNPPLRSKEDVAALRGALAEGVISVIASDHAPHTPEEKARPWGEAPFGVIGLETSLGVVMTRLVAEGVISLAQMVRLMHLKPHQLLCPVGQEPPVGQQPSVGQELAPATVAGSVTLLDPNHEWLVDPDDFYSKGRNCPFAGWRLKGKAVATIVRGKLVMRDGEILP